MTRLTVGVAMCTYNGEAYLRQQLESIAGQTRVPDRMVIVDDGSADRTRDIARDFAREAGFPVQVICNPRNLGYAKNFEKAIRLCEADLIALSDQDDVWHRDKLEKIAAVFQRSPEIGLVFTDAELVGPDLAPLGNGLWESLRFSPARQALVQRGEAFHELLKAKLVTGATMVFRSRFKDLVLPVQGGPHDAWIALLVAAVAEVGMIAEPLIRYRQHPDNQIGARKTGRLERLLNAKRVPPAELDRLRMALDRLAMWGDVAPHRLTLLRDTVDHLAQRTALPGPRLKRLAPVWRGLWSGQYRRLSGTSRSALHDVIAS